MDLVQVILTRKKIVTAIILAICFYLKRRALLKVLLGSRTCGRCKNCYCVPPNSKLKELASFDQLAGSVKKYERHLFIAAEGPESSWESHMDNEKVYKGWSKLLELYPGHRSTAFDIKDPRCIHFPGIDIKAGDVLLFPENVHVSVEEEKNQQLVEALDDSELLKNFKCTKLPGRAIFVCGHTTRDNRCGIFGQQAYEVCKDHLPTNGALFLCSHVGGHKFSPNILISGRKEKLIDFFGLVPLNEIKTILTAENVPLKYWRGRQGLDKEEVIELVSKKAVIPM